MRLFLVHLDISHSVQAQILVLVMATCYLGLKFSMISWSFFLSSCGDIPCIQFEFTAPDTPQQNGIVDGTCIPYTNGMYKGYDELCRF